YSQGYKSGGQNFGTCNDPYDPEKVTSYELGYKARIIGSKWTASLAIFDYNYRDLQVYNSRPISAGGGTFIDNAPKARIRGIEGETTFSPDGHFSLNTGFSLLNATYRRFTNIDSTDLSGTIQDLRGNHIIKSPEFTGNLGFQY